MRERTRRLILIAAMILITPLALFYLFVVPMLTALSPNENGWLGVGFGAFMLLQLFMLVGVYAVESASAFYGFSNRRVLKLLLGQRLQTLSARSSQQRSAGGFAVIAMFLSYACFDYAFAVLYVFISHVDTNAFSPGPLTAFNGWYFSGLTGATVSFGDIIPKSHAARLATMAQVSLSVIYVVLLFSASSSYLSRPRANQNNMGPAPNTAD